MNIPLFGAGLGSIGLRDIYHRHNFLLRLKLQEPLEPIVGLGERLRTV